MFFLSTLAASFSFLPSPSLPEAVVVVVVVVVESNNSCRKDLQEAKISPHNRVQRRGKRDDAFGGIYIYGIFWPFKPPTEKRA
jgi:hypothetical protein